MKNLCLCFMILSFLMCCVSCGKVPIATENSSIVEQQTEVTTQKDNSETAAESTEEVIPTTEITIFSEVEEYRRFLSVLRNETPFTYFNTRYHSDLLPEHQTLSEYLESCSFKCKG